MPRKSTYRSTDTHIRVSKLSGKLAAVDRAPGGMITESLHARNACIGTMNRKERASARQRLGVRQSSAAFGHARRIESARGLAQSKTWRHSRRFMENLHDSDIAYRDHEQVGLVARVSPLRAVPPLPSRGAHGATRPSMRLIDTGRTSPANSTSRFLNCASAIVLSLVSSVLFPGCGSSGAGGPPPEMAMEVVIEKPTLSPVEDVLTAVGSVEANERVELKPKTSGLIESIHFNEGQRAVRGQKLFELDYRKEAAGAAQAEAEEKLARSNVARARTLAGTKAISQQELDQLENQVAVKAATRQVEQERLSERTLVAPFDGMLGPRLVSPGQYVNAGSPLATLVDDSKVKVRFRIPERQLALVRLGLEGRLRVAAYEDRVFTGKVDLINPEVDEGTRTAEVRLMVPNPDSLLKPGMFARVELLVAARPQAVVIPEGALVASLERFSVYAVEAGAAKLTPIKLGVRMPGKVEVREGLSADQAIVVSGTQKLVDGMKVVAAKTTSSPAKP